jgi:hypothetical protein
MSVPEEISSSSLDEAITSCPWAKTFRAYLRQRNLKDDENILKFLVLVQVISWLQTPNYSFMPKFSSR